MKPLALVVLIVASMAAVAQDPPPAELFAAAYKAYRADRTAEALKLVDQYVAASPADAKGYLLRAAIRDTAADREKSLPDYDKAIQLDPKNAEAYMRRGVARFKLGKIDSSIADFDKQLELDPDAAPQHWQRGIALYYAGRFEDGAKQFEIHKTVNPNDVENAAWHFLCVARWKGVEAARAGLIPIEGDARVPMMTVHQMFAGKATADDVIAEARRNDPTPARLKRHLFYAHLYIGLYDEALGKADDARKQIDEAVRQELHGDYMYDTAVVHQKAIKAAAEPKKK